MLHEILFHMLQKTEQDFYQSSNRTLWTGHFDRNIFSFGFMPNRFMPKKVSQTAIFKIIPGQIFLWKEHISIVHEILFHMLQKNRTRLLLNVKQTTLNLPLRSKNLFARIYAKKESAANGTF